MGYEVIVIYFLNLVAIFAFYIIATTLFVL